MHFISATPILASLDVNRSVEFFCSKLGFSLVHATQGQYGIVVSGSVEVHFWACAEKHIAEATACRIQVSGIDLLYQSCVDHGIVHPNAALSKKAWGSHEFAVLDPDGNLITFHEPL